ncbi:MAG: M20 family metallopeptidase, partial [Ruminococcaceae bacterium]|nr:M20 family metallopeptidase [Oscillospiraceae bacterium]
MDIFGYIEKNKDRYLDFWSKLCSLEGNSHDKDSVNAAVDFIEEFAVSEGFSAKRYAFGEAADYIVI